MPENMFNALVSGISSRKTLIDNVFHSLLFVLKLQKHNTHLNNNCLKGNVSRLDVLLALILIFVSPVFTVSFLVMFLFLRLPFPVNQPNPNNIKHRLLHTLIKKEHSDLLMSKSVKLLFLSHALYCFSTLRVPRVHFFDFCVWNTCIQPSMLN